VDSVGISKEIKSDLLSKNIYLPNLRLNKIGSIALYKARV
jgi:hypothetical protein